MTSSLSVAIPLFFLASCTQAPPPVIHAAAPDTPRLKRPVRVTGTVEAVRSSKILGPQIWGQGGPMTLTKLIPNGSKVSQGDLVAVFDSTQQIDLARDAEAKFDDLGHQVEQKRAQNRADAEKRTSDLRQAEADLAKAAIDRSRPRRRGQIRRPRPSGGTEARPESRRRRKAYLGPSPGRSRSRQGRHRSISPATQRPNSTTSAIRWNRSAPRIAPTPKSVPRTFARPKPISPRPPSSSKKAPFSAKSTASKPTSASTSPASTSIASSGPTLPTTRAMPPPSASSNFSAIVKRSVSNAPNRIWPDSSSTPLSPAWLPTRVSGATIPWATPRKAISSTAASPFSASSTPPKCSSAVPSANPMAPP